MKKQEPLPQVRPDEAWFDVPTSWSWVRLGTITQVLMGQSPPGETYNKTGEGIPLINGPVEFTDGPFGKTVVNQYTTAPTNLCEEGDLLLCVRGSTTGRTNIAGFRACIGRGVAAIRPFFADQYVRLFIWRLRAFIIAMGRGIAFPSVSRQQIEELPVPLPPLAEQHRIVAKVDELMALCDRLEAAQAERERRRDQMAAASLHRLNNGADSDAFREHARFHLRHLPRLATRPEHIQQLRQTILNLAVSGKLVSQDLDDESAYELLMRIEKRKAHLLREARIKKTKACRKFDRNVVPHSVPMSWTWTMLGEITDVGTGSTPSRTQPSFWERGTIPWITSGSTSQLLITAGDEFVTEKAVNAHRLRLYQPGTLLVALYGQGKTRGQVATLGIESTINQACAAVCPLQGFEHMHMYLKLLLKKNYDEVRSLSAGGAQPNLNVQKIKEVLVPLPPLAEQHRIVAKVEELMALCNGLEAQLTTAQTESCRLLEAVLRHALAPALADAA
jgi:type I restriction enzyme S subunit